MWRSCSRSESFGEPTSVPRGAPQAGSVLLLPLSCLQSSSSHLCYPHASTSYGTGRYSQKQRFKVLPHPGSVRIECEDDLWRHYALSKTWADAYIYQVSFLHTSAGDSQCTPWYPCTQVVTLLSHAPNDV